MITLSPSAIKQLNIASALNKSMIRLALRAGGCAGYSYDWSLDTPTQDDSVIEGCLIVDNVTADLLGSVSIAWQEDMFSSGWNITSEHLSSCGCGSSVSVGGNHG
jgi:iron-sulfur cluster assembly accessory protein